METLNLIDYNNMNAMYANIWDERFKNQVDSKTIANLIGCEHKGPVVNVDSFNTLDQATSSDLSFCRSGYEDVLRESDADVVICDPKVTSQKHTLIHSESPKADFVHCARELFLQSRTESHTTGAEKSEIGEDCFIAPNVIIGEDVIIGDGCVIGPGTTIGQPGFGYQLTPDDRLKNIHHEGKIRIEDGVHIGAHCTIDRSVSDETVIGKETKIHHLVSIGNNAKIGERNRINQHVSISGSVVTGNDVRIHPQVTVGNHVNVGDGAEIGANSTVLDDVPSDTLVVGSPASPVDNC